MPIMKDDTGPMKFEPGDAMAGMPEEVQNTQIGPMIGVAAIALNMALKYHDIATVQDGTLYQQYKLEGRNMCELHLDIVFETAMQIEEHLISANKRVAMLMVAACLPDDSEAEVTEAEDAASPLATPNE